MMDSWVADLTAVINERSKGIDLEEARARCRLLGRSASACARVRACAEPDAASDARFPLRRRPRRWRCGCRTRARTAARCARTSSRCLTAAITADDGAFSGPLHGAESHACRLACALAAVRWCATTARRRASCCPSSPARSASARSASTSSGTRGRPHRPLHARRASVLTGRHAGNKPARPARPWLRPVRARPRDARQLSYAARAAAVHRKTEVQPPLPPRPASIEANVLFQARARPTPADRACDDQRAPRRRTW
jgi:hypothetical protein